MLNRLRLIMLRVVCTLHNFPFAVHPPPQQHTGLLCPEVTNMALLGAGCGNVRGFYFTL